MGSSGLIVAVCVSGERGTIKLSCGEAVLKAGYGFVGDAHAGDWPRQVSLLAGESVAKAKSKGVTVVSDNHGENLTTRGIVLHALPVGTKLKVGDDAILEITQIGKAIHDSPIFDVVKNHILPHKGVFARVIRGGTVKAGDFISVDGAPTSRA